MSSASVHVANGYLSRPQVVGAYALVLVTLLAGTVPVLTGDGYEYIGMTMHMAQLRRPAMTVEQARELEYRLARLAPVVWSRAIVPLMLATCLWSLFAYNPARPEGFGPTRLSALLWNRFPGLDNPVPEIFTENTWLEEAAPFPAATPNCSKLLLLDGVWRTACPPAKVPDECRGPQAICYANRIAHGYEFVRAGRAFGYPTRPSTRTWPRDAQDSFVPWLVERWWEARAHQAGGGDSMLRATENIERVQTYEGEGSLLVYFHNPQPGALARLHVPWHATEAFVEPSSGQRIAVVSGRPVGSGEFWELPLPEANGDVVLVLSR